MQKRPIDAKDPAVSHERDLLHTTSQAALQQRRACLAAGSELWPVRTVLNYSHTKEQPVAANRICPMVIAMWSFCVLTRRQ